MILPYVNRVTNLERLIFETILYAFFEILLKVGSDNFFLYKLHFILDCLFFVKK